VPPLHIIWTMDCEPVSTRANALAPRSWDQSARTIEGFCSRLLVAGYPPTLFLAPECAHEHSPLLEELHGRGVELALLVDPPLLPERSYRKALGEYSGAEQREIITLAGNLVESAVDVQPRSLRSGGFSASNETYRIAYELGFRQGSLSNPGQERPRQEAAWVGAPLDAHYIDTSNRLLAGSLPFLELPPTVEPSQLVRGVPWEMRVEVGTFEEWLKPIAESQLARMEAAGVAFRALCIGSRSGVDYTKPNTYTETVDTLLDYFDELSARYEIVPVTLAAAHDRFRRMQVRA